MTDEKERHEMNVSGAPNTRIFILKEEGNKKVKISHDGYGLELSIMRNGYQWGGQGVDDQILGLICAAIADYFNQKK